MYSIDDLKRWVEEHEKELDQARLDCPNPEVQSLNRIMPDLVKAVWDSGGWMRQILRDRGVADDRIRRLQFAHGQRSLFEDPYLVAVRNVNTFITDRSQVDEPGEALANQLNEKFLKPILKGEHAVNP